jgi:Fe-S cluster assembly iron-binding protein IscA
MALDEPTDSDTTVRSGGVDFIYSKTDEPYLNDSIIDFEDSYMGRGFTVRAATSGCC